MMVEIIEASGRKTTLHINFPLARFLNPSQKKHMSPEKEPFQKESSLPTTMV